MNEQLIALAAEVKKYREQLAGKKTLLGSMQQEFNAEHHELLEAIGKENAALQGAESDLRKATVAAYFADPEHNKNVLPGVVAVRDNIIIGYDPKAALDWAVKHEMALLLDTKVYETLVKAGQAPGTVVVEPQATIAREIQLPQVVEK